MFFHLEEVDSTNTYLMNWAQQASLPEGTVVSTDFQLKGKGRLGRTWDAVKGENLLFSVLLIPPLPQSEWGKITLISALVVQEVLQKQIAQNVQIKWPNDIWIQGKKVCGMLLESSGRFVVLGIGINVNQLENLPINATSLAQERGRCFEVQALLTQLVEALLVEIKRFYTNSKIPNRYQEEMLFLGQEISFKELESQNILCGKVLGITQEGALKLETASGEKVFFAGEISTQLS